MRIPDKNHMGNPIIKKGRRFPNLPGFLLSDMTPKMIAENAAITNCVETPRETIIASKLIVYI